jgi:glycosyltransferase involved in cell wall biosynthesis
MRIAVWHNLPSGGGKRALYDQVRGLVSRGHEVALWCPPTADQEFLRLGDLAPERVLPYRTIRARSTKAAASRLTGGASRVLMGLRAMDLHARSCAQEMNQGCFDVLLAASCSDFAVTSLACHAAMPSVLYLQEPCRRLYEAMPSLPWAAPPRSRTVGLSAAQRWLLDAARVQALRIQVRAEREGVQSYHRVLVNSLFSRESVLRAYGLESTVCYLGVDTEEYRVLRLPREQLVVGVGEFVERKRVEVVIEAVCRIGVNRPSLVWVGNVARQPYLRKLTQLAERLEVNFRPLVGIPQGELIRVLNQASVMVHAPRLEPFGYAPLEAGACGLPVVAVAEGGVRETVVDGETGFLVDSAEDLAPALNRLLRDEGLARSMGIAGRARAASFWSLPAAAERLESQLLGVISRRQFPHPSSSGAATGGVDPDPHSYGQM